MRPALQWLTWRGTLSAGAHAVVLCLALGLGGAAQAATPPETVRALVLAGELDRARAVLLAWAPRSEGEAEQRLWLLAVVHREAGEPARALAVLEALVARRPDVARFRLELADTLAKLGQKERAAFHYDLARGGRLDPRQRARAATEARRMDEPGRWTGSFGIALAPSSNPDRKTQEKTIDLGFGQAVLSDSSRAQPATGMAVTGRLAYAHRLSDRLQAQVGLRLDGSFYPDATPDDVTGTLDLGLVARTGPRTLLRTTLSFQERHLDGVPYSRGPALGLSLVTRSGARGRLGFGLSLTDLAHPGSPAADGLRAIASLTYTHALSADLSLRGLLRLDRTDAASAEIAATSWEVGIGASRTFAGGLILDGDLRFRLTGRDGPHAVFGVVQQDRRETLTLRLRHSELRWAGFAPYAELVAEWQQSNIAVYGYDAHDLALGLTRRF